MIRNYLEYIGIILGAIVLLIAIWSSGAKRNPWALVLVVVSLFLGLFIRDKRDKL